MIKPTSSFKENLQLLPPFKSLTHIELLDPTGTVVALINNQPGKQGSLAVYHYLEKNFDMLNGEAARHGLTVFAEHVVDAKNRPGAHPNIDILLEIVDGAEPLNIRIVEV
jgi:hypothetical protein